MSDLNRDYQSISIDLPADAGRYLRMRTLCDALWTAFGGNDAGYSWCGFYVRDSDSDELILAARQPKPACSPIGLNGICGQSLTRRESLIVRDVRTLSGGSYIACDPRDLSEVVVPMLLGGRCWGVLDVDSFAVGAFDEHDALGLLDAAHRAGLCDHVELASVHVE